MKYRLKFWCEDCCGVDFQGGFEGGTKLSEEEFDSVEEATAYARSSDYAEEGCPTAASFYGIQLHTSPYLKYGQMVWYKGNEIVGVDGGNQ